GRRVQTVLSAIHARPRRPASGADRGGPTDPRVPASTGAASRDELPHGAGGRHAQDDPGTGAGLAVHSLPSPQENARRGNHRPRGVEGSRLSHPESKIRRPPHGHVRARVLGPGRYVHSGLGRVPALATKGWTVPRPTVTGCCGGPPRPIRGI